MKQGLIVEVFKTSYGACDGKANFSSRVHKVTLLPSADFPNVPEIFPITDDAPAVVMVKRQVCGGEYLTAYPADKDGNPDRDGRMFGGCYIATCDSRFPFDYPVPLHDRLE